MLWTDGHLIDRQRRPCHGPLYGANDSEVHGLVFSLCVIGNYQLREMQCMEVAMQLCGVKCIEQS